MSWVYLAVAGIMEVVWATALKFSEGLTKPLATIVTVVGMIVSFVFLSQATKNLPLGTAYAIWTGIGAVGAVLVGIFLFHEHVSATRIIFLSCILIGIIGLKITTP